MSFLQRLRASLGGGAPQPGSPAAAAAAAQAAAARAAIAEAAEDLVDVRFSDTDPTEVQLAQLWDGYERALQCDREVSREMLFAFFDRFTAAFAGWQPDPSTILAARAAAAAAAAAADVSKAGASAVPKPRAHLQLLAAFRPAGGEGQAGKSSGGSGGDSSSSQRFHAAAVAALWGGSSPSSQNAGTGSTTSSSGSSCAGDAVSDPGTALQQQVLLFAARLLGREQRLLPLLPAAAGQVAAVAAAAGGGVGSSQALTNLQALRSAGLWDAAFGPAFFFWAEHQPALPGQPPGNAAQPAQPSLAAAAAALPLLASAAGQQDHLRQLVLVLLEAAASLPAASSNLAEVSALMQLLRQHPRRHALVAPACRVLLRLLGCAPATTLAALQEQQLLTALPRLLAQQQEGERPGREGSSGAERGEAGGEEALASPRTAAEALALEDARCAALELLGAFLSTHSSIQQAALAAWDPVAALFSLLLRPAAPSRRLAMDSVLLLMQVPPASEDDRLAKAALFTKFTETLPAAVRRWRQLGVPLLLELLSGVRAAVEGAAGAGSTAASGGRGGRTLAQQLFAQAQAFLQVANILNEEYPEEQGPELCCAVLDTLTALVAGSPANRRALGEAVGYPMLLEAATKRLGQSPPPRRLLLSALGLLLEEAPGPGAAPRFATSAIRNPPALPLLVSLLRRAAPEDQLWGLAAVKELLLQGVHNLAAADGAALNSLLIEWLQEAVAAEPAGGAAAGEAGATGDAARGEGSEGSTQHDAQQLHPRLLLHQLLAVLTLSGSYSIAARDLRTLLQLLKPAPGGEPPSHSAALLEALTAMAAHEGPTCFFSFGAGSSGMPGRQQAAAPPSGIVCTPTLGGGSSGGPAGRFVLLPKAGYSFAAWLQLEDGRGAAEQLASADTLLSQQAEHASATAAAASAAAVASDQAVFALLHQQQPSGSHSFMLHHQQQGHLLQGVALAIRRPPPAGIGPAGSPRSPREGLQLVAHSWSPKHAEAVLPLQHPLVPGRWHHVAVSHSAGGPLSHPALSLFIDGQLQATARLKYPSIRDPLSSVCVGAGALLSPLRGQAGAAIFFEDVLLPGQVAGLHQLGPNYQSPLLASGSEPSSSEAAAAAAAAAAAQQGQPPKLLLAFCPQLAAAEAQEGVSGTTSSSSGGTARGGSRGMREAVLGLPAALLPGTQLCRTQQPHSMLHCLGGIAALLPLLEHQPGGAQAAGVVRLVAALLRGSPTNQQAVQQAGGFALMAHLLEQRVRAHRPALLTPELLAAQQQLLGAVTESRELSHSVLRHLLLNLRLWSAAAPSVQHQLLGLWAQLAQGEPLLVRGLLPPASLLHHVRRRYFSGGSDRRARQQTQQARQAQQAQQPAGGSGAAADAQLLQELLSLPLLPLLRRDSLARLPLLRHLQQQGGPALLLPLLQLEQQQLRLLGLRAVTAALAGSTISGAAGGAATRGGSRPESTAPRRGSVGGSPLPQQLQLTAAEEEEVVLAAGKLLSAYPLTAATRIALVELLCDGVPWPQIDALAPPGPPATAVAGEWDATGASAAHVRVRHPAAAALLLRMASEPGASAAERAAVLQLLLLLCSSASLSQQAQQANQDQLLAAPIVWQQHLLDCLSYAAGSAGSGSKGSGRSGSASAAADAESEEAAQQAAAAAAWRLWVLLLGRGIAASPAGWQLLQATVSLLKARPGRTYLAPDYGARSSTSGGHPTLQLVPTDSWHLLQGLLADAVLDLLAAQAAAAATAASSSQGSSGAGVSSPTAAPGRPGVRRTSSEWDAWTLVSQWSTEPYCSNAAALLSLIDDYLSGGVLAPPGGSLAPSGAALLWADPAAASGDAAAAAAAGSIPQAVWVKGLSQQALLRLQQQRGLLLLQRLLLHALLHAPPELAQQAASQCAQLLPALLADAAAETAAAEAAAARLQLMLAAVVQVYRSVAARAQQAQQDQLLPLQLQQRLAACEAAASAIVDAAPWVFGLRPAADQQQQAQQQAGGQQQPRPGQAAAKPRLIQELLPLLQPRAVVTAAQQQLLFMHHCCALHEGAVALLQQQLQAAAAQEAQLAAAAEEGGRQCLGRLLAADRLRRAAGRQAADEATQLLERRWRDLARALKSGRGLWADEEQELHWKLDATEDPSRRRLRLRRNFHFERYVDAPRGSSASLAAAAEGAAEPAEVEVLAVVPGTNPLALTEAEAEASDEEGEQAQQAQQAEQAGRAQHAQQPGGAEPLAVPTDESLPGSPKAADEPLAAPVVGAAAADEAVPPSAQQPEAVAAAARPAVPLVLPQAQQPQKPPQQQPQQQQPLPQQPQPQGLAIQSSEDVEAAAAALPAGGAVLFSGRCQWVTPKRVLPGQLQITATQMYFVADLAGGSPGISAWLSGTAGSSGSNGSGSKGSSAAQLAEGAEGAAAAGAAAAAAEKLPPKRRHRRWQLIGLTEVHHSRYLLQPTALECFMADRTSHAFFNFPSQQAMRDAAAALQRARPSAAVYDRRRKVEWALRLQQRWLRWEVSTFDYLMALNTLAGRSYNDLNQYPVFPWVLADYSSATLDLNDPASFRDLSKPIGALNDKRLQFFLERFESLRQDRDQGGHSVHSGQSGHSGEAAMPPFHYGSHYSNAGIVLFYLLRLEPFTKLGRALQGGRFDHADRLFHSVAATWQNVLDNTADVKELVPEFYCSPEFLLNANRFALGVKQDGAPLDDVVLPPWARGSADEFVRVMREALESEHVSQRLHDWIDLIFGVKQRGKAAEEAVNTFYYLTYEGTVNLDAIPDPEMRFAVEEQIRHFGQTPMQLFRRRHPPRGPPPPPAQLPLLNGPDAMRRSALALPPPQRSGIAVSQLWVADGRVLQLHADRTVSTGRWLAASRPDLGAFTFSSSLLPDASAASLDPDPLPPRPLAGSWAAAALSTQAPTAGGGSGSGSAAGQPPLGQAQFAVAHGDKVLLSGGYFDCSLRAHSADDGRLLQALAYHKDLVTCVAASSDGRVVVSGSADTTLMVWDANPAFGRAVRGRQPLPLLPRPRCALFGHRDRVTCVAVSPELDLVVSGAADGTLLLHSLSSGAYVRSFCLPHGVPPALLCIAPKPGLLLAHSHVDLALHLFNLNCRHLASADTHERLAALCPTPDGRLLLAAGTSGLVTLRWLHSLQVVLRYDSGRGPVTALAVSPEGCFLAGTAEGSVVLFAPDPRRRITTRFNLAA
ncbi:BEACH domain-containing lvsC isoform X1 isoform B [Chlorella sorokiniana]|uniref:BEACH domain-containing lvsC isoform X1 isoform B n=1 Tax=Chlorella sorokiniana TaxID=3076 RepID=A0A2P6TIE0_CHLSO|nr:BEACH domain-containing lvsC isoform X1 isoform B [Chlorella sorokiniana]|eukprot:PRW34047.1 BEACH domain-containing lvsC isoform X1 isoform B [Chlorella sorokiniana]